MAQDPQSGLFFPAEQATAAVPGNGQTAVPPPTDPAIAAAVEALKKPRASVTRRRMALRWVGWGSLLLLLAGWGNGFLSFFRPGKTGAFGSMITAAGVEDLKVGDVKAVTEGKFYLTRVPEGFIALWWKCPHLGCTVPWKPTDPVEPGDEGFAQQGRFNCPCHGSIYNRYGQIITGPAPRPMDRFPITIEAGKIRVDTSKPISREKAGPEGATPA